MKSVKSVKSMTCLPRNIILRALNYLRENWIAQTPHSRAKMHGWCSGRQYVQSNTPVSISYKRHRRCTAAMTTFSIQQAAHIRTTRSAPRTESTECAQLCFDTANLVHNIMHTVTCPKQHLTQMALGTTALLTFREYNNAHSHVTHSAPRKNITGSTHLIWWQNLCNTSSPKQSRAPITITKNDAERETLLQRHSASNITNIVTCPSQHLAQIAQGVNTCCGHDTVCSTHCTTHASRKTYAALAIPHRCSSVFSTCNTTHTITHPSQHLAQTAWWGHSSAPPAKPPLHFLTEAWSL